LNLTGNIRDDLDPDIEEAAVELAHRLVQQRPVPRAAFRGELRRQLIERPRRVLGAALARRLIAAYATTGAALLTVAAAGAAGVHL
jgi:hypothetical protein